VSGERVTELVLVANARMPSERAQSLQVAQAAAAFARKLERVTLLYADRRDTPALPAGEDLWSYYSVPAQVRPQARGVPCSDWIDRAPRALQYLPARLQELTFARNAARIVRREFADAVVLTRELETARALRGRPGVFLELHRVPGGRLRRRWLLAAAETAAGTLAISGGVRADLVALGLCEDAIRVEHDAFEPGRFDAAPGRADARRELELPADAKIVVYTGGLLAWKGVDVLVEAARGLPEVQFAIAGGMDADVARLRARARGLANVRIDGFQPPARVALYLAAANVGVVPNRSRPAISARYTSPLKVFEAMAAGLPLVASDLPSLRAILSDEEAVFVAPDEPGALAAGLTRLLGDDGLRERLAGAMRARAAEHTWDARTERILHWMDERRAASTVRVRARA